MSKSVELAARPKLIRNCRLSNVPGQEDALLMPEGAIRLNRTAVEIVKRCDGARTVQAIVDELLALIEPGSPARARVEPEVKELLATLHEKRVLDFK